MREVIYVVVVEVDVIICYNLKNFGLCFPVDTGVCGRRNEIISQPAV